mgnify:CR=1 FL=1
MSGIDSQNIRFISKAISNIENESALKEDILLNLKKKFKSYRVGITGPPGSGKSTIVNHLIKKFRIDNKNYIVIQKTIAHNIVNSILTIQFKIRFIKIRKFFKCFY